MKIVRSERYLAHIRQRPSVVSGLEDCVAHHVRCLGGGGMGLKPSDLMCVPLTPAEHEKLHRIGEKRFWDEVGIDPAEAITAELLVFLAFEKAPYAKLAEFVESFLADR